MMVAARPRRATSPRADSLISRRVQVNFAKKREFIAQGFVCFLSSTVILAGDGKAPPFRPGQMRSESMYCFNPGGEILA